MKIGLILPGFSASETDWCIPVQLHIVRELSQRHDVRVFPLRYPHQRKPYRVYGAEVQPLGGASIRGARRIELLRQAIGAISAEHRRGGFDVLHGTWADEPGFVAVAAGRRLGVPSVVSLVGGELVSLPEIAYGGQRSRINRWLVRKALCGASAVTAGSDYIFRLAAAFNPVTMHRLVLGVDTSLFQSRPAKTLPSDEPVSLVHVGSLEPVKDQAMLLNAMHHIVQVRPNTQLYLIGDGAERDRLQARAVALDIQRQVCFLGTVPHHRLPDVYHSAHLCLLTSRHEGQGLVTLEAAACGRTTVGTAVGILPDIAPEDQVVPVGDSTALAQVVLRLLNEPERLAALGEQARQLVEQHYSLDRTLGDLEALYAQVRADTRQV